MRKHLFILSLLISLTLGIGQMWGADPISTNSTWTATAFASIPDDATVVIINNFGKSIANATVTKAPAKIEASYSTSTKKITVSTTGKSLDDIAWTIKKTDNGTQFWVYGSTTNVLGFSKLNDNNAVAVNATTTAIYNELAFDDLLTYTDGTNTRFIGEYVSGSDWRSYNSKTANNYKSSGTAQTLTFYVLDAGTPPASNVCETPTFSVAEGTFYESSIHVELSCTTTDAVIHYTLDGSAPTASSATYSSAIEVSATTTIKAIAVKEGLTNSDVASATYTKGAGVSGYSVNFESDLVAYVDWEFSNLTKTNETITGHGSSTYYAKTNGTNTASATTKAKIATPGVVTYYVSKIGTNTNASSYWYVEVSSDGSTWTKVGGDNAAAVGITQGTWTEYTADLSEYTNVYVRVYYKGTSAVRAIDDISIEMAVDIAKPIISGTESFLTSTEVSITCTTSGADIYYTTDGSDPKSGTKYTAALSLTETTTVRAIAKVGNDWSAEATSKTFTKIATKTVAEAIAAIPNKDDVVDDQYVAGIVCTAGTSVSSGKMTYYISDDGSETNRLQIYKGKNLNNTNFTAATDLVVGDRVVVFGQLKNYNGTKEMNEGNYLISKAAPTVAAPVFNPDGGGFMGETDVTITCATGSSAIYYTTDGTTPSKSSTLYEGAIHLNATTTIKAIAYVGNDASLVITKTFTLSSPMTVAEALTALDSQTPINNAAVSGIISTAPTSNPSNGRLTYYISDDGSTTSQLEVFNGFGLNGASFSDKTDLQVGDEVTVFGNLKIYSETKEFDAGSRLLVFNRPAVAVTSVTLDETATVKVGKTINLSASVLPANATDQEIVWSIQSGNDKITLSNGAVTGVAEGEAVVRATSHADNTKYAECTVTIAAADPTYLYYNYVKVTATADIVDGEYLIVYEGESVAFNGGLETLDAVENTIAVEINDGLIVSNATTDAAAFTINVNAGTILSASVKYIGVSSNSNGLKQTEDATTYSHTFSIDNEGNAVITAVFSGSTMTMRYNADTNQKRFRYFKSTSNPAIQLYKKVGTNEAPKAAAGLAWNPADDIELTVGDAFTAPTLSNPNSIAANEITITSSNTNLATVNNGVVSLVANATGEATITASFAGNDNYKAAEVSYKITVNAAPAEAVSGKVVILAEYENKFYAMSNSLNNGALEGVEVEKDGDKIVVSSAEDKTAIQWTASVSDDNTTLKDANDKYIKGSNGTQLSLDDDAFNWNWDGQNSCYINSSYNTRGLFFYNTDKVFKGYALSNITKDGYAAIEVIEIAAENIIISSKIDPDLAYTPSSDEITVGDAWSAPSLGYVDGFDGLAAITYASNNEAVATVSDAGVIALAGGTGTATITATFGGNASYIAGSATYTVQVNAVVIPDDCDGTDDFSTIDKTVSPTGYASRTTTNGWQGANVMFKEVDDYMYWVINGKTTAVGVITSPVLSDGIASLKIRYANTFSETNGVSFRVDIKQGENVVKTYTITKANSEVTQNTVYTEEIENINVSGEFQIVITNLSPSNNTGNKDRLSIGRLCWTNYDAPQAPSYTDIRTGLTAGNYYTVCYSKAMTAIRGGLLFSLGGKETSSVYLVQEDAPFVAGSPYILYATADKLEAVVEGDDAEAAGSYNGLYGTLSYMDADALTVAGATYMLYNNSIRPIGTNNHLDAGRAYIILEEIQSGAPSGQAPSRVRAIPMQGNVATDVEAAGLTDLPTKVMIDGQLFILRSESLYDMTGRLVK